MRSIVADVRAPVNRAAAIASLFRDDESVGILAGLGLHLCPEILYLAAKSLEHPADVVDSIAAPLNEFRGDQTCVPDRCLGGITNALAAQFQACLQIVGGARIRCPVSRCSRACQATRPPCT